MHVLDDLDAAADRALAFYDVLADRRDVKNLMGDSILSVIAHNFVDLIRPSVTIDWTQKEAVRAEMPRKVKRLLRKYRYPPDKHKEAVLKLIQQVERVCKDWSRAG